MSLALINNSIRCSMTTTKKTFRAKDQRRIRRQLKHKKPRGYGIGSCLRDRDLKTQSQIIQINPSLRKKMTTKIAIAQSGITLKLITLIQIKMSQTSELHMTCRVRVSRIQTVILRKIKVQKARTSFILQKKQMLISTDSTLTKQMKTTSTDTNFLISNLVLQKTQS